MARRILIGGYEIPGYSGTTAAYQLFQMMLESGWDAHYVNLVSEEDLDFFKYTFGKDFDNPRGLPNVYCSIQRVTLDQTSAHLKSLIDEISPDVCLGIGHIPTLLLKRAAGNRTVVFITHGCREMLEAIERGEVKDYLAQERKIENGAPRPAHIDRQEAEAVALADFVITHSASTNLLYRYFFPEHALKISRDVVWFGEWIRREALSFSDLRKPFADRDVDVLFIAGSWARPEKNYALVRKLVTCLRGLNIHIVGEVKTRADHATYHGLIITRQDLFSLLGRTKAVVCPSLFDAAPGILFEGSAMDCNLVASKNCGNWQICNERLLVDPFTLDQFLQKTALSVSEKFDDNMSVFLNSDSYRSLLETLSVF
jgi:glycosyltransferase involved in cell wall biosynthesis